MNKDELNKPPVEEDDEQPPQKDVSVEDGDGEDDITDQHHQTYGIRWSGANMDVDGLVKRFDNNRIRWPDFQRQFIWTRKQSSRLIESILIGLPIPTIFLYQDSDQNYPFIIDGLQRMMTLTAFKKGRWLSSDPNARLEEEGRPPFRLIGLPEGSRFLNKTYHELHENDQQQLDDTLIHVLFIEQRRPSDNQNSAFHIFERLNSGGTSLQAQEMRNALFSGKFRKQLYGLTQNELWGKMFGKPHKRAKDQELILRFLALLHREKEYKSPMTIFLNNFMKDHRDADEAVMSEFSDQFIGTMTRIYEALGYNAFRPFNDSTFSAPYFDAFMVAVASNSETSGEAIKKAHEKLLKDTDFKSFTLAATTSTQSLKNRIRMVREAINDNS